MTVAETRSWTSGSGGTGAAAGPIFFPLQRVSALQV